MDIAEEDDFVDLVIGKFHINMCPILDAYGITARG